MGGVRLTTRGMSAVAAGSVGLAGDVVAVGLEGGGAASVVVLVGSVGAAVPWLVPVTVLPPGVALRSGVAGISAVGASAVCGVWSHVGGAESIRGSETEWWRRSCGDGVGVAVPGVWDGGSGPRSRWAAGGWWGAGGFSEAGGRRVSNVGPAGWV